jgi:hypothetical protein
LKHPSGNASLRVKARDRTLEFVRKNLPVLADELSGFSADGFSEPPIAEEAGRSAPDARKKQSTPEAERPTSSGRFTASRAERYCRKTEDARGVSHAGYAARELRDLGFREIA